MPAAPPPASRPEPATHAAAAGAAPVPARAPPLESGPPPRARPGPWRTRGVEPPAPVAGWPATAHALPAGSPACAHRPRAPRSPAGAGRASARALGYEDAWWSPNCLAPSHDPTRGLAHLERVLSTRTGRLVAPFGATDWAPCDRERTRRLCFGLLALLPCLLELAPQKGHLLCRATIPGMLFGERRRLLPVGTNAEAAR